MGWDFIVAHVSVEHMQPTFIYNDIPGYIWSPVLYIRTHCFPRFLVG